MKKQITYIVLLRKLPLFTWHDTYIRNNYKDKFLEDFEKKCQPLGNTENLFTIKNFSKKSREKTKRKLEQKFYVTFVNYDKADKELLIEIVKAKFGV